MEYHVDAYFRKKYEQIKDRYILQPRFPYLKSSKCNLFYFLRNFSWINRPISFFSNEVDEVHNTFQSAYYLFRRIELYYRSLFAHTPSMIRH